MFKLHSFLARFKEMRQCFLVNGSVLFVPRKDESFSSVKKFFAELRRYLPLRPPRNNESVFLVFVRVAVITSDDDDDISPLSKKGKMELYTITHKLKIFKKKRNLVP